MKWSCYVCDPRPLYDLIALGDNVAMAMEHHDRRERERDLKRIARVTQTSLATSTPGGASPSGKKMLIKAAAVAPRVQPYRRAGDPSIPLAASTGVASIPLAASTGEQLLAALRSDERAALEANNERNMKLFCQWASLNLNDRNIKPVSYVPTNSLLCRL